ncbi:MAG: zincin-like metallopeptidase domain-containing protein, partial [Balneolales bacterium]
MISSVELGKKEFTGIDLPEPFRSVLGKLPPNFSLAIWGPAGSGKSTVAVDLAWVLANTLGKGIYCSSEEGAGPSMQNKFKRLNAEHPELYVKDFDGMEDLKSAIKYGKAAFCIFDSASMSHIKVSEMEDIHDFCKKAGVAFIYILHATKAGDFKGNSFLIHMPDTVLKVEDGVAKTTKNRFADTPQEFDVRFEAKERENPLDKGSENIISGIKAMKEVIETKTDIDKAMKHPELGWISFIWGRKGNPKKSFAGGYGISKILAKRDHEGKTREAFSGQKGKDFVLRIPIVIEKGILSAAYENGRKMDIDFSGYKVVIRLDEKGKDKRWLLTAFRQTKRKNPGEHEELKTLVHAYAPTAYMDNRPQMGAGLNSKDTKKSLNRVNPVDEECLCGLEYIEDSAEVEDEFRENKGVSADEIYQMITDRIISTIQKSGKLPWHKPWSGSGIGGGMTATNFVSKNPYRGINWFMLNTEWNGEELVLRKFSNPYFLTFKQVGRLNGKVKKGSKGNEVVYFTQLYSYEQSEPKLEFGTYSLSKFKAWLSKNAGSILDNTRTVWRGDIPYSVPNPGTLDELLEQSENWYVPILKYYNVFHAEDIEGVDWGELPKNENVDRPEFQKIQVAEAIWESYPTAPDVRHRDSRAFYVPDYDYINLPVPESFDNEQYYYSTLFHEGVHSTGHASRLDRPMSTKFGDRDYNFEELVAEMGAAFLCSESGILFKTIDNSTAYLQSFGQRLIKQMEENNRFFFRASSRAQEAADYILDRDQEGTPAYLKNLSLEETRDEETESIQTIGISGNETSVDFKADGPEKHTGKYQLIEATDLTASHNKDCSANSKHRISRGQPRDRSLDNLCAQPKFIAKNLNPDSITHGNLAFQGAPVVMSDGMTIQGNGRSIALKIAYDEIEKSAEKYKKYLASNAKQFGFIADDVNGMNKPVLVRMLDVDNEEAIRLGNVVDTSQAKMNRIDQAKAIIRGLKFNQLEAIGRIIGSSQGETIGAIIDDIGIQLFDQVKDLDRTGLIEKNELTADGKEFLRSVLTGIIFDSEEHKNALRDYLGNSRTIQAGIERSFGSIIPLMNTNGDIRSQIQQTISITAEIKRNDAFDSVDDVMSSQDMFSGTKTYKQQSQDL